MNSDDRKLIDSYEEILVEKTNFKQVYTLLLRWKVIPVHLKAFKDVATGKKSDKENNKILYHIIKARGSTALNHLKRALKLTNPELFQQFEGKKWSFPGEQWSHSPLVYNLSRAEIRGSFCIVSFTEERLGWEKEVTNLNETFQSLRFQGSSCQDPGKKKLEDVLMNFTSLQNAGCYVFALCGHGDTSNDEEVVRQADKSYKSIKEIVLKICNAPALLNKPKIIILQLCRGDSETVSFRRNRVRTDVLGVKDTIILRPCLPGHVAYRDSISGGWFITVLTEVIQEYARSKDVEEIMIEDNFGETGKRFVVPKRIAGLIRVNHVSVQVCKRLAEMRANKTHFYELFHESRYMIPCAYTYSFKKFYFVPEEERS